MAFCHVLHRINLWPMQKTCVERGHVLAWYALKGQIDGRAGEWMSRKSQLRMRLVASRCALRVVFNAPRRVASNRTHFLFPAMTDQNKKTKNTETESWICIRRTPGTTVRCRYFAPGCPVEPRGSSRSSGIPDRMAWSATYGITITDIYTHRCF